MSDTALTTQHLGRPLPRQALEAKGRTEPLKVTGKLKVALDLMVWECLKRDDAAAKAGLSVHGLREALRRPHVRQHYLGLLEVLRSSERARNIHRAVEIRDAANNMPAMHAIRYLDAIPENESSAGTQSRSPGVVIIVQNGVAAQHTQAPNQVQVIDNAESEER